MPPTPGAPPPRAPKKNHPWWGIVLWLLGAFLLVALIGIGGIVGWLAKNKERLIAEGIEQGEAGDALESTNARAVVSLRTSAAHA